MTLPAPQDVTRVVARNIVNIRARHGLSTTRLAAELKAVGQPIPPTGITRIEKGQRGISVSELVALAAIFGVEPAMLLQDGLAVTVTITVGP